MSLADDFIRYVEKREKTIHYSLRQVMWDAKKDSNNTEQAYNSFQISQLPTRCKVLPVEKPWTTPVSSRIMWLKFCIFQCFLFGYLQRSSAFHTLPHHQHQKWSYGTSYILPKRRHVPRIERTTLLPWRKWSQNFGISREMVLTTPESIIEQASTEKLLDILIDESVRTSARKPIMMQVRRGKNIIFVE